MNLLLKIATSLPRGGFQFMRLAGKMLPALQNYQLDLPAGFRLNADLRESVFFQLLKYGCYPHQIVEDHITQSFLRPGDVVIDVGASIGYTALLYSKLVGPSGMVFAFEPSKASFRYLEKAINGYANITAIQKAVSNLNGTLRFLDDPQLDRSSSSDGPGSYEVTCTSLDDWSKLTRLDFLKVDCEGKDFEALSGASDLLSRFAPIVEFEAFNKEDVDRISSLLDGYTVYRCRNEYPFNASNKPELTSNYFAIPESRKSLFPQFLFTRGFLVSTTDE